MKEGLKKTLAEGEVGEMEETVREIGDVCLGEVFVLKKLLSSSLPSSLDHNYQKLQDS